MPNQTNHPAPPNRDLSLELRQSLQKAERVAVLAVGSDMRADDAAGLIAGQELLRLARKHSGPPALAVFMGGTAPENLTGPIKTFQPTHLIVIDAADMGQTPGCIQAIDPLHIADAGSFSTHSLPLTTIINYLRDALGCRVLIVGIQPGTCEYGLAPSPVAAAAARRAAKHIFQQLRQIEY